MTDTTTSHRSPLPDVELPQEPLTPYVLARVADLADRVALVDAATGEEVTFAQLDDRIRRLAGGLVAHGFQPGQVLAVMAPNCPAYAVVFHGTAMAGGTVTTINPTYTEGEVHHQLEDSGATILVTIPALLPTAKAAMAGTAVTEIYVIGEADGERSLDELVGEPLAEQVPVDLDDVVVLPYSSGTTGLSKGVMLTHRNLTANIAQCIGGGLPMDDSDSFVAVLPFFHIYGMQVLMNCGLRAGAKVVTMPRFDLPQFLQLHQEHGLTRAFVAPPMVVALAKHPIVDDYDMSALRIVFSGAAPLSAELAIEAGERLGCEVVQGYGMTELSPVTHATPPGGFKPGSVGVTMPNTELRIVDPAGASLGLDEDGEVWVRGPQVMKGYLNNAEATAATVDADGWLHTGDVGHVDADGHLYVVDRLKELIKYKGFQVPPAELEALLLTHPAVADAAVIGRADDEAGEIPVGFVVLKDGQDVDPTEIQAFVAERVAHYKQVREIHVLDAIPKSPSGKILRRILRDEYGTR